MNLSLWLRTNCFSSVHEQKSSQRQRQRTFLCIAKSLARFIALLPRRESFAIKINGQKLPPQFREIVCLVGACFARKRKIPILPWRNGQKIIYLFSLCEICSRKDILSLTQRKREKRRSAAFPFFYWLFRSFSLRSGRRILSSARSILISTFLCHNDNEQTLNVLKIYNNIAEIAKYY